MRKELDSLAWERKLDFFRTKEITILTKLKLIASSRSMLILLCQSIINSEHVYPSHFPLVKKKKHKKGGTSFNELMIQNCIDEIHGKDRQRDSPDIIP